MNVWRLGLQAMYGTVNYHVGVQYPHTCRGENFLNVKKVLKNRIPLALGMSFWRLGLEVNHGRVQYHVGV